MLYKSNEFDFQRNFVEIKYFKSRNMRVLVANSIF